MLFAGWTLDSETSARLWSFPTLRGTAVGGAQTDPLLTLSPDGSKLALTSPGSLGVDIWDPGTGRLLYELPEANATVYWLAWHPNSQRLAVARSSGEIAIWDLEEVERSLGRAGLTP